eukprot:TRINITY_DN6500_c0_g1_i2.p1 TRINITY_DN6500_c0_g1~~TRINITY_DN6500_c0_g1_i2.p1  ORF type:complete len:336 (-),score=63.92 TRINITY_DN6500_c0_g1_i2:161-1141(-)
MARWRRWRRLGAIGPDEAPLWDVCDSKASDHVPLVAQRSRSTSSRSWLRLAWGSALASSIVALGWCQRVKCHEKCKTCHLFDFNMEWHCIECMDGYELWVDGCFLPCPDGQFRFGYNCEPCTDNCQSCVGSLLHECTKCKPGFEFDPRGVCLKTCPEGTFPSLDGRTCRECNAYCRTCIAEFEISCLSCYEDYSLRILDPATQSGQCMLDCPDKFYRDAPTDLRCISCPELCATCTDPNSCTSCVDIANLYRGACYVNFSASSDEGVNFKKFLNSGAGIQWDEAEAPSWKELMIDAKAAADEAAAAAAAAAASGSQSAQGGASDEL